MGSGKRASMREGPLAALFRKTETGGPRAAAARAPAQFEAAPEPPAAVQAARGRRGARARPTPQERLRHAFSSDLPENMMSPPAHEPPPSSPGPAPYYPPPPEAVGSPQLRVVGVGGAGVNAVNRMIEAEVAGVQFVAVNTDVQSLQQSDADITLQIGARPHARARLRLRSRARSQRGDGGLRPHQVAAQGLGHGVHHRGRGRRHRHGRRPGRRADRAGARRADGRHRLQAVRLRGLAPRAGRRGRASTRWRRRSTR